MPRVAAFADPIQLDRRNVLALRFGKLALEPPDARLLLAYDIKGDVDVSPHLA
jgi:hypothetical protein